MAAIRRGGSRDLDAVAAIQNSSPEAAHWPPTDYLGHEFRVAVLKGNVVGFLVARTLVPGEYEILNLAVAPEFRRRGIARHLIHSVLSAGAETVYLEVRESNAPARNLYKSMGFQEVAVRREYYQAPPEGAIVLKFHSC
jgi:[ribosomal protein S18]-alanine N-acetyltransferase